VFYSLLNKKPINGKFSERIKMTSISRRNSLTLALASLPVLGTSSKASATVGLTPGTKLYEHTFLKAKPGLRGELGKYIAANWFPMDQKGLEQGIFTCFWLLEETGDNEKWDYVMVVGYPTELGYGDLRTTEVFQAIRKTHLEIKIDGKSLRELGDFVGNHRLKIVTG
jgi:hypothetical protein